MKRALVLAFAVFFLVPLTRAQGELDNSPDFRAWNQPRGTASGSGLLVFEPIRSAPLEAWRHEYTEVLSNVVQWGGFVYAVVKDGRERKLIGIDVESGEVDASSRLGSGEAAYLAAWNGQVVLLDEENMRQYSHLKGKFRAGKRIKGNWYLPPAVYEGVLFTANGAALTAIDLDKMKEIGTIEAGAGRPAISGTGAEASIATYTVGTRSGYRGNWIRLFVTRGHQLGFSDASMSHGRRIWLGACGNTQIAEEGYTAYCGLERGEYEPKWFIRSHYNLTSMRGGRYGSAMANGKEAHVAPIMSDAVILNEQAYGFSTEGALVRFDVDGKNHEVVGENALPDGAVPGSASGSKDVLYFGNWAHGGRVQPRALVLDPAIEPDGPLMPDGRRSPGVPNRAPLSSDSSTRALGFGRQGLASRPRGAAPPAPPCAPTSARS